MTKEQLKKIIKECLNEMEYDPRDEPDSSWNPSANIPHGIKGKTTDGQRAAKILNDLIVGYIKKPEDSSIAMGHGNAIVRIIDDNRK